MIKTLLIKNKWQIWLIKSKGKVVRIYGKVFPKEKTYEDLNYAEFLVEDMKHEE